MTHRTPVTFGLRMCLNTRLQAYALLTLCGLLAITLAVSPARAESGVPAIKNQAQQCATAMLSNDYETAVRFMHKRLVASRGGKQAIVTALKRDMAETASKGYKLLEVKVGEPEQPRKIGAWTISLVPERITMKVPGGTLKHDSHMLGISEDDGTTWVFVETGGMTDARLVQVFPEFAGKFSLPKPKEPTFIKGK